MSLVSLSSLGVTLGTPLFSGLDLEIRKGDRIGLVAANGGGKSTLLRCLAGRIEPTEGACRLARNTRVALMAQDAGAEAAEVTVRELLLQALPPESREWEAWRADVCLDEFEIAPELRDRPFAALSGGWQRMVLLAKAWLAEPDLLLLDEPTNHLDLARIGQLERWMAHLPHGLALVVASHDRAFLDRVTNRTLFLRREGSIEFSQPFSAARASLAERDAAEARRYENDLRQAAQLRRQAAKLNNIGVNSGSDLLTVKTRQLKERAERIETSARPAHREDWAGRISLAESGTEGKTALALDGLRVETPDGRLLFTTGRLWLRPGDRVAVLGRNGTGKSRLLALVAQALGGAAKAGIRCGPSMTAGICDQSLSHLRPEETLSAAIGTRFSLADDRIRALLAGAGFPVERQGRTVSTLSGGQKARLAMLILRLEQPNFYLLDEPTNHLDIAGQEGLEAEIQAGEAACLFVSHDRRFTETIANRFWRIEKGRLAEAAGPKEFFEAAMNGV